MTAEQAKMTANAAKVIADSVENEKAQVELLEIENKIKNAAERGLYSITSYTSIMIQIRKELEKRGFKIDVGYDQRDGDSWTTISW